MKCYAFFTVGLATLLFHSNTQAQSTFDHTSGDHLWNIAENWTPDGVPNAAGTAAILPSPTADLTVDLGEDITIGSLEFQKPAAPNSGDTMITGSNSLTVTGGPNTISNNASDAGSGVTSIEAPIVIGTTLTINQASNDLLLFNGVISGGTGLTIARTGTNGGGPRTVVLGAANTYGGDTTLIGSTNNNNNFLIVRLLDPNAIPASSNIVSNTGSVVLETSGSFERTIGTGTQLQFSGGTRRNGWSAFGGDLTVTLNGGAALTWSLTTWNELVLGTDSSTHTATLTNPIVLNGTSPRIVRTFDGAADIDGRLSGEISGAQTLHKLQNGILSLSAANTYTGTTLLEGGTLRLDHVDALGSGNLTIGNGALLGLGVDTTVDSNTDFARDLGTDPGQIQLIFLGGGNNAANGGFSAFGADRTVTLNSNAELTWGENFFLSGGSGTPSRNLILNDNASDATISLTNPIDLGAGNQNPSVGDIVTRAFVVRNGTAEIDAVLSGALRGTSSLTKDNSGTLALSANNTYEGGTNILAGRLLVNNTPVNAGDSGTGTGNVSLSGTAILGGTGTIAGTVTVASGTRVEPGVSGIESLDVGGLTLEADSILEFELGAPGNSDLLNVTISDGLTINGGVVNLTDAGGLGIGNYTLIDYAGALMGSDIVGFLSQTPTGPAGFIYALVDTGSTIDLAVMADVNDADFNDDGIADAADYVIWRKFNGAVGTGTASTGDANGDTNVDDLDYNEWREIFGSSIVPPPPGTGNGGAVPEPSSIVLLALGLIIALHRRSKCNRV